MRTMEELRDQIIQAEEEYDFEEEGEKVRPSRPFLNLEPWQRFVLAILLFLSMALCGCMALVVSGRVMLPF